MGGYLGLSTGVSGGMYSISSFSVSRLNHSIINCNYSMVGLSSNELTIFDPGGFQIESFFLPKEYFSLVVLSGDRQHSGSRLCPVVFGCGRLSHNSEPPTIPPGRKPCIVSKTARFWTARTEPCPTPPERFSFDVFLSKKKQTFKVSQEISKQNQSFQKQKVFRI